MSILRLTEQQLADINARNKARLVNQSPGEKRRGRPAASYRDYSGELFRQIVRAGLPMPVREYKFAEDIGRKWRLDLAWPNAKLAIEVDGMVHRIGDRFFSDMEKMNELVAFRGWRVLRVYTQWVAKGEALPLVRQFLRGMGEP